jgi:hypothetical protein
MLEIAQQVEPYDGSGGDSLADEKLTDLFGEDKDEEKESKEQENSSGRIYVVFWVILLPVYFLVRHIGGSDTALTATLCLATVMVAVGICWDLRKHIWFWAVTVLMLALHIPLILMLHWPHYWIPGVALTPIGFADCMIIVGIIRLIQKFIVKYVPTNQEE